MGKGLNIVGSARTSGHRDEYDFYPTPKKCTKALLKLETFQGSIGEPACGKGHISKVLERKGYKVVSSDLIDRNYGLGNSNFLLTNNTYENIITNPPYNQANKFIEKAKEVTERKIAMFLKTTFLESAGRYKLFKDTKFPLKAVYQFSRRVSLYKYSERHLKKDSNGGMVAYAWFVWDKKHTGKPFIDWILL